jgi:hypothetical protein
MVVNRGTSKNQPPSFVRQKKSAFQSLVRKKKPVPTAPLAPARKKTHQRNLRPLKKTIIKKTNARP